MTDVDDASTRDGRLDARLLRPRDLIDLQLIALGCTIGPGDHGTELVAGPDASLLVVFPPQHIGEEVWQAGAPPPPPQVPPRPSRHVAAGPSRLVYALPEGTRIPYDVEGVLAALPSLVLRVSPNATPSGEPPVDGRDAEPPSRLETAIEAPYHLIVSPSARGAFRHAERPVGPPGRAELWRTHLTVRTEEGLDDEDDGQRIVRGLWTRDHEVAPPNFEQPLVASDREAIVDQTHGGDATNADTPLEVRRLSLSSLGAWFDWRQSWEFPANIVDYRHQAYMGRDGYVRVVYPGFLFPFGHRCYLVKLSERDIKHPDQPVAYLWQRHFLIVRQPTRTYPDDERDNPFRQVTVAPLISPDIDRPPDGLIPFVPSRNGIPFRFALTTIDRGGETRSWSAPLVFVRAGKDGEEVFVHHPEQAAGQYFPVRKISGHGQTLAVAPPVNRGDTSIEVVHLVFEGEIDTKNVTSRPHLAEARAVVPSMRHLSPQAPAVDLRYAVPYTTLGLPARDRDADPVAGVPNAGEMILAVTSSAPAVDFSSGSDRAGGFVAPNLSVKGLSRALGAVGVSGDTPSPFDAGKFDPSTYLAGALPRLFGLFDLVELLEQGAGLDRAPKFVADALQPITKLLAEAQRLRQGLLDARARLVDEVANGAHDGAKAVAQHALDEFDARTGTIGGRLDVLVTAVKGLPATEADLRARATELLGELPAARDAVAAPGVPAAVRSAIAKPVAALTKLAALATTAAEFKRMLDGVAGAQVSARLDWRPRIRSWGLPGIPGIFVPDDPENLRIDVEVRASASASPAVDVLAELVDFDLNLVGDAATALMELRFRRVAFHAGSTGKPEVDVVFGGIGFLGPLSFVDRLREIIPFDGFSDPPYTDVSPEGVVAGFDLALPNVAVGAFSLENIALGADARVPFLGDAMTVGFHFCSKESPFRLTVMCIGGGGWLELRASPKGLVVLELGLEACAALSVDLGVASGSVSIAVGVYLRLEADRGVLTAYFRIRGEVDVLGLISASITLELALAYDFDTGKLIGRASLTIEVEVLFFSASVEITVERRLAGSKGDPTMSQVMPPDGTGMNDDWAEYCGAFAPLPT
ncbi:hypothetical protein [Agromyces binzhouensis]|uniref:hypothetical protein n=1 Tax=Agromyces binzhouensis TaxID=1817495 RepID=UPI0036298CB2